MLMYSFLRTTEGTCSKGRLKLNLIHQRRKGIAGIGEIS